MYRAAFKIGLPVAAATSIVGWIFAETALASPAYAVLTGLIAGAVAFAATARLAGGHVEHVSSVLGELANDGPGDRPGESSKGDEFEQLSRMSDVALSAVRKRVADLNRADSYRREYLGDVSHEIRTPIFAIQGFAETLLNGALNDSNVNRTFVEKIFNHAGRLDALARDLSEISRLESRELKLLMTPFSVQSIFDEVEERLGTIARQKEIDVRLHVAEGASRIHGDRERICQVVSNLVENAIKYTNLGGWVDVRAEPDGRDGVRVSVEDNGIGVESHDIGRITERFYRADKSRARSQGGSGLGLSIVKHILAAHGTTLSIDSRVGEGSTFSFTLPTGNADSET